MAESESTPPTTSAVPLIDPERSNKLDLIRSQVESVVSNREQLKTIITTLIVANLTILIIDSFYYGSFTGLFSLLCFIISLTIYSFGVWSITNENYPSLILFAGLLILIRLANLFSFLTTDNIIISLGIITFIILNELYVVQERQFPAGQFELPKSWSSQSQQSSSSVNYGQRRSSLTTININ